MVPSDDRPGLSRETLWLRFGGLSFIAVSLILFASFEDVLEPRRWLAAPTLAHALSPLLCFVVSANVMAIGFTLVRSGVREQSLTTSPQARRAALVRLAASNCLLPGILYAVLIDDGTASDSIKLNPALQLIALFAVVPFVYVTRIALLFLRSSWKYDAPSAEQVLGGDPRPPVLYLRSFGIDDEIVSAVPGRYARLVQRMKYTATVSPEQELASVLDRVGPVVAIGKPGERLPQLGAARLYVDDSHWRDTIDALISQSALVAVRAGNTPNLWWEVERAMTLQRPDRVIIVVLGSEDRFADFHRRFIERFGVPMVIADRAQWPFVGYLVSWLFSWRSQGIVIYFDQSRVPYQRSLVHPFTWSALLTTVYSAHGAALRGGLEPVLDVLRLPWKTPRRSLTFAVLLAFLGGIFALHHFYLGDRRRGLWCCLFFWTPVPVILGVIDAMRFSLLNEAQFQARFGSSAPLNSR